VLQALPHASSSGGVYTRGLILDGARFNMEEMSCLDDSQPKQLYT
jgi:hypothetical protein